MASKSLLSVQQDSTTHLDLLSWAKNVCSCSTSMSQCQCQHSISRECWGYKECGQLGPSLANPCLTLAWASQYTDRSRYINKYMIFCCLGASIQGHGGHVVILLRDVKTQVKKRKWCIHGEEKILKDPEQRWTNLFFLTNPNIICKSENFRIRFRILFEIL